MTIKQSEFIWKNGKLVPWDEANVHVLSHALHYGSSVFEGIRVYTTPEGPAFFRLREHVERLEDSAKIYRMPLPWSTDELEAACIETVVRNRLDSAYVRPLAFRGYGSIGIDSSACAVDVIIAAIEWGRYLGADGIENGIDCCVSSWSRLAPNTMPAMAKAGGNYLSSQLIHAEARRNGFTEGIALAPDGKLSEGSGENIFVVHRGKLMTPSPHSSILLGITRDTVLQIAGDLGYEVVQTDIPREMLYLADEVFLVGTAAEITPVRTIDRSPVGSGVRGPITQAIQDRFFGLFSGDVADKRGWLTPVGVRA